MQEDNKVDANIRRHKWITKIAGAISGLYLRLAADYHPCPRYTKEGPFLVISNHVTDYDQFVVGRSFRQHMYYVIGEHTFRSGWISRLLRWAVDPIPCFKATIGTATVRRMLRRLKQGQCVCIFAEGSCSHNGLPNPIPPGTGHLVQRMNCTLITYRIEGGFFIQPRWAKHRRHGYLGGRIVGVYPPEQLREMPVEELNAMILADIGEDAYAANAVRKSPYRGKALAEGLEFELGLCPKCGAMHSIHTRGDRFFCDCGLEGTYDEYGLLHGRGFSFTTVTQWDLWQREEIAKLPEGEEEVFLVEDSPQTLTEIFTDHSMRSVVQGTLRLSNRAIYVGEKRIAFEELERVDIFRHGFLLVNTADQHYYEIRGGEKYPGYLYLLLMRHYLPMRRRAAALAAAAE